MELAHLSTFAQAFIFAASLVFGLGPTNIFVLRQGLRGDCIGAAVFASILVDVLMIAASLLFVETALKLLPNLRTGLLAATSVFIVFYIIRLLRSAFGPGTAVDAPLSGSAQPRRVFLAALTLSLLNPYVWLDMLLIVGGYLQKIDSPQKAPATLGVISASLIWFPLIGYGAKTLGKTLTQDKTLRTLELASAAVLSWVLLGLCGLR